MWWRRLLLAASLCGAGFAIWLQATKIPYRPNILLFIGDDIDFSYYGFQGHEFAQTPNLDRLASEGVVFSNGYATASSCRPALQTLVAGVRSHTWDSMLETIRVTHPGTMRRSESQHVPFTLPRLLRQAGYSSFAGGKMWEGTFGDAGFDAGTMLNARPTFGVDGARKFGRDSMRELYDFIDSQSGPWFAWVAPMLPHAPFDPPEDLRAQYQGRGLTRSAVPYFANLTRMDGRVGDVLSFIEDRGLGDNTVVIYLADNGWEQTLHANGIGRVPLGEDRGKMSVHDRGFRTPIIVRWPPEVWPGRRTEHIVTFDDVFETILGYADAPSHDCSNGRSFRQIADDGRGAWQRDEILLRMDSVRNPIADVVASRRDDDPDNDLALTAGHVGLYMRGNRWAYSSIPERGVEELYDLIEDPMGLDNLSEARPKLVDEMRRRALAWNAQIEARRCPVAPRPSPSSAAGYSSAREDGRPAVHGTERTDVTTL